MHKSMTKDAIDKYVVRSKKHDLESLSEDEKMEFDYTAELESIKYYLSDSTIDSEDSKISDYEFIYQSRKMD